MEAVTNSLNWFEIPVTDFDRGKAFYNAIFDYDMRVMEMGAIKMGMLPNDPEKGVGGAISHGAEGVPSHDGVTVYLNGGADLAVVLDRVEAAGGKVLLPKTQISPEIGYMAFFEDTEGNKVGLHSEG